MRPKIIPVIHYLDDKQAMRNARIATDAGCRDVMLIDMEGHDAAMINAARKVKESNLGLSVGINCLTLPATEALSLSMSLGLDMTWTDQQLTHSSIASIEKEGSAASLISDMLQKKPEHEFFVGVAFKHQQHEPNPQIAIRRALKCLMIPTTSGPATGRAADAMDIERMRASMKEGTSLAIASGISPENIEIFASFVTHILVSTGVSSSFHELNSERLGLLVKKVEEFRIPANTINN